MKKKFLIYAHGGSYNHGAEAILQTTISMIRNAYAQAEILVSTHFPEQDREFGIDADILIPPDYKAWEMEKRSKTLQEKRRWAKCMYSDALKKIQSDVTLLSIGGDNFCYQNWHRISIFQEEAKRQGVKSILWGASIEPSEITSDMVEILNTYTYILARESITHQALLRKDISASTYLLPDIAFSLPMKETVLPTVSGYVGINVSPLVIRRELKKGILLENLCNLVRTIAKMGMEVVLIPHVTVKADNDYDALRTLYASVEDCQGVYLLDTSLSASEYKRIISECSTLICTRTHASIAAYSCCVPTLVLGYSVKARGIAADLGMPEMVLDIEHIDSPDTVLSLFRQLNAHKENYREHLCQVMQEYKKRVEEYAKFL